MAPGCRLPEPGYLQPIPSISMRTLSILAAAALAVASASAQSLVFPQGFDTSNTGSSTLTWRSTAFRFQMLYDTSHWTDRGVASPLTITRLRFRANGGVVNAGGSVFSNVTIQLSSSPLDPATMSTTFASNVGANVATVFNGNVTSLPAAGGSPNDYVYDITLTTPFVYDPSLGNDLLIDVSAPTAPAPTTVATMATSNIQATHRAKRLSAASVTATTGALSDFASVVLIDYSIAPGTASASNYGGGCGAEAVSFHETFGTFDLGGSSFQAIPNLQGGYDVVPGSSAWYTPTSANLALGDDVLSPQTLPFTFPYPGGATSQIQLCSNGYIWLDPLQTLASATPAASALMTGAARIAPFWNDLDPSFGGTVTAEVDTLTGDFVITFDQVPQWNTTGLNVNTFQVRLKSNGAFEVTYQTMLSNNAIVVGMSPGGTSVNPGNRDISASIPFSTRTDGPGLNLTLRALNRPVLGTTLNLQVGNIAAISPFSAVLLSFQQVNPGANLVGLGLPGCFQHVGAGATHIVFGMPTATMSLGLPTDPSWIGALVYAQGASLVPGFNATGATTSNGVKLELGNL